MTKYTWTGNGGDSEWSNASNWNDDVTNMVDGVPGPADSAYIDDAPAIIAGTASAGVTVLNAYFQAYNLAQNDSITTVLSGKLTTTNDLAVTGDPANNAYSSLELDLGAELDASNVNDGASAVSIDNDGEIFLNGGAFNSTNGGVQVGYAGTGTLSIVNDGSGAGQATFTNSKSYAALTLGDDTTGAGYVDVDGVGSSLTVDVSGVNDGYAGYGSLDITNSAVAQLDDDLFLGSLDGATGVVNVQYNGAQLNVVDYVAVGEAGLGEVYVRGGGSANFGFLDVAVQSTSGDPSTADPSIVYVQGGNLAAAVRPFLQPTPDPNAAYLTVTGAIRVGVAGYGELYVGQLGFASGASLDIAVDSTSGAYGGAYPAGANSNTTGDPSIADIEDGGSLTIAGAITVGDAGYGELSVDYGATASGDTLVVANQSTSGAFAGSAAAGTGSPTGNPSFVNIDDATLTITNAATIGDDGYGALYIEDGGSMTAASMIVANATTSGDYGATHDPNSADTGSLSSVDLDDGSLTIAGQLIAGDSGYGGVLVTHGSTLNVGSLDIAAQSTSGDTADYDRSYVEVTDDNSTLIVTNDAVVGDGGYGALTVFDGATATIGGNLFIGSQSTSGSVSAPDFVDVDGKGTSGTASSIAVTGSTTVGYAGYAELNATNGGTFSTSSVFMANGAISADSASLVAIGTQSLPATTGIDVEAGATISGFGSITGSIENDGSITASGGVLQLDGAFAGSGDETIDAGATIAFMDAVTATGDIHFSSTDPLTTLELDAAAAPANDGLFSATLANFGDNDALDLTGLTFVQGASAVLNGSTLVVTSDGVTEDFTVSDPGAARYYAYQDSGVGTIVTDSATAPCYVRGTRILTERGEVAVEDLRVGDLAVVASGASRPVRWLGHRSLAVSRHPKPADVRPVRVSAHAFGEGLPRRDLWLSPGHNIAWEGALMPISSLINGRSVVQVAVDRVEYWHVELDAHDVMLAEGLPAESYLDTGNRTAFGNGGAFVEAHPDFKPRHWADTCLPLVDRGPAVLAAKARLHARLIEHGHKVVHEADLHVLVDGIRFAPIRLSETRFAFALPSGGRDLAMVSNTFVPAHTIPESADPRELGLCVGALQIDGANIALAEVEASASGWHAAEFSDGRFCHRWTTGATPLPAGARIAIVDLAGVGRYWRHAEREATALFC